MHTTPQPDPAALAFLAGVDVRELEPDVIEPADCSTVEQSVGDPDTIDDEPAIH